VRLLMAAQENHLLENIVLLLIIVLMEL